MDMLVLEAESRRATSITAKTNVIHETSITRYNLLEMSNDLMTPHIPKANTKKKRNSA